MMRAVDGQALRVSLTSAIGDLVIPGLQMTNLTISSRIVDVTTGQGDGWRRALSHAGQRTVSIGMQGLQLACEEAARLRDLALSGASADFVIELGDGARLQGPFVLVRYVLSGAHDDVKLFELTLDSAGQVTLAA